LLVEWGIEEGMEIGKMLANPSILPLKNNRCDHPWYRALKTSSILVEVPDELAPVDRAKYIAPEMRWKRGEVVRVDVESSTDARAKFVASTGLQNVLLFDSPYFVTGSHHGRCYRRSIHKST
jgi:hypothetical protein